MEEKWKKSGVTRTKWPHDRKVAGRWVSKADNGNKSLAGRAAARPKAERTQNDKAASNNHKKMEGTKRNDLRGDTMWTWMKSNKRQSVVLFITRHFMNGFRYDYMLICSSWNALHFIIWLCWAGMSRLVTNYEKMTFLMIRNWKRFCFKNSYTQRYCLIVNLSYTIR